MRSSLLAILLSLFTAVNAANQGISSCKTKSRKIYQNSESRISCSSKEIRTGGGANCDKESLLKRSYPKGNSDWVAECTGTGDVFIICCS